MFRYSTIYINAISFLISTIIFFSLQFFYSNIEAFTSKSILKAGFQVETENINNQIQEKELAEDKIIYEKEDWILEIPIIDLKAKIQEGTSKEIMDNFIGHFEETSKEDGNIGLAAHNRGYAQNYFANIKKLKEGDDIFYQYQGKRKKYKVIQNCIIKDTDWTYLEETKDNRITLITCVENQPEYRRCIQGKESEV